MSAYRTNTINKIINLLQTDEPHRQTLKISEVTGDKYNNPGNLEEIPWVPDETLSNGTKLYMATADERIWLLHILRG